MELTIKNMVCDRCIKVVRDHLNESNLPFMKVELGKIYFKRDLKTAELRRLNKQLVDEGFEILKEEELKIVEGVKFVVISEVRGYSSRTVTESYSNILSKDLGISYSKISRLFSQVEGKSIERFIILQKIEMVKELMTYGELTMSEIAYEMNYSSPQHLSKQFKQVTGLSPTEFKGIASREKLDNI
jgi:AraC-like DNA-binding protein